MLPTEVCSAPAFSAVEVSSRFPRIGSENFARNGFAAAPFPRFESEMQNDVKFSGRFARRIENAGASLQYRWASAPDSPPLRVSA